MVQLTGDYIMAETEKKQLKTFSLHEKNMKYVAMMKKAANVACCSTGGRWQVWALACSRGGFMPWGRRHALARCGPAVFPSYLQFDAGAWPACPGSAAWTAWLRAFSAWFEAV